MINDMVRFRRIFHPVGHGAFFTERFTKDGMDDVIVVYDCGCKTKDEEQLLEQEVEDFFNKEDRINILFISHFDSDHVSGIKYLMPYIDNNTRLLMPFSYEYFYLTEESPILYYMGQTLNLIEDSGLSVKQYWVRFLNAGQADRLTDYRELVGSFVDSGTRIGTLFSYEHQMRYKWMYVPFNLYNDIKYKRQFERKVSNELGKLPGELSPTELDEITITKLRSIYKEIGIHDRRTPVSSTNIANGSKNINENSLIVLSKATSGSYRSYIEAYIPFHPFYGPWYRESNDGSCLYTGDSNLKSKKVYEKLCHLVAPYISGLIYLFQLPHHGSRQYYGKVLMTDENLYSCLFVNCGEYDFQQGSFPKLLADVVKAGKDLRMVTCEWHSKFVQTLIL